MPSSAKQRAVRHRLKNAPMLLSVRGGLPRSSWWIDAEQTPDTFSRAAASEHPRMTLSKFGRTLPSLVLP